MLRVAETTSIADNIKQFFVSLALKAVRFLVQLKPMVFKAVKKASNPFRGVGRIFVSVVMVPAYRVLYLIRRQLYRAYRPAKNKFMLLVTNRYTVHVIVGALAVLTGVLNLQTNEVRAESFGERSLMYRLVSEQETEIIEEYASESVAEEVMAVNYRQPVALEARERGLDRIGAEDAVFPLFGGTALSAPPVSDRADSVAPREGVELYAVQPGDTLSTIAEQFNISINTLLWTNDLSVRSVLRPGDEIEILPVSGVRHKVDSGDTLSSIANSYDVDSDEIIEFNKLASADDLVVGEELIVPGGQIEAPKPVSRSRSISRVFTPPSQTTTKPAEDPPGGSTAQPTRTGTGRMIWPTDLRVITQYYGWRHTGLDIDCKFNNDNYAADDGVVRFTGWKGGYGYTVEVNHGNGLVTRYGHHASIYVSNGQQVAKGQALGRCGTTGRSTGTHLHFEVLANGRFRNPLEYIR